MQKVKANKLSRRMTDGCGSEAEKYRRVLDCLIQAHEREQNILAWIEKNCEARLCATVVPSDGKENSIFIIDGFDDFCRLFDIPAEAIHTEDTNGYLRSEFTVNEIRFFALSDLTDEEAQYE